jgi:hypothetical protein
MGGACGHCFIFDEKEFLSKLLAWLDPNLQLQAPLHESLI